MTCPKCKAEPTEFWYDGSCIEHGRPEPVEGRWYWIKYDEAPEPAWKVAKYYKTVGTQTLWVDDLGTFEPYELIAWLLIPTVEELLLTTKGKI